eukprot:TRINITY_DN343_c0_g1_i1.p1 TRINITY_DN343_c0_g1~~TRINITY_DN343_c0_g1_i1.p1  ORF type:complete len:746 (+),score=247.05 TRINITY_DN343_c0_g1_i1:83-2320(+)
MLKKTVLVLAGFAVAAQAGNYHGCESAVAQALPYCDPTLPIDVRTKDLVSRMTLEEQIKVISPIADDSIDACPSYTGSIDRLGVPNNMWLVETNTAVASACYDESHCATTFVSPAMLASSFNRTSWRAKGSVIGTEMRAFNNLNWHRDIDGGSTFYRIGVTGYGPNMNIVRDPRFGRNQELPSEDPFLSGNYAAEYLQGMQEEDKLGHPKMIAYVKHFTDYTVENNRGNFDANVSMFDFFDSFLPQYEIAFKQGRASGAMCSYNAENGHPSCANGFILNEVMRNRWGRPDALITSDCGAISNMRGAPLYAQTDEECAAWSLMNGTDVEAGSRVWTNGALANAVTQGLATAEAVAAAGQFDPLESIEWSKFGLESIGAPAHKQANYEAALQGLVLLKNEDNFLPLKAGLKIAVVGPHSVSQSGMVEDYYGDQMCWTDFDCITTIGAGLKAVNNGAGGSTVISKGVDINSNDQSGMQAAIAAANDADVIILAIGIDRTVEHEGQDRTDINLPGLQEEFAKQVLALGIPTVMVVLNGGAVAIDGLINAPKAIIEAWYPSTEGARALAAHVFGYENRFGKLPISVYPSYYINQFDMNNMEMAKYPGRTYRYYSETPLFSFGHGLSYTTFKTSCAIHEKLQIVTCDVTNTGSRDGDEVVMLFHAVGADVRAQFGSQHPIPLKNLIGFERVSVAAKQTQTIVLPFDQMSLSVTNEKGDKVVYPGSHQLTVSRDGVNADVSFVVQVPAVAVM